jgi:hypothetical protein
MDVRVEAGVLQAGTEAVVATVVTQRVHSVEIVSPVVTSFSLAPVISVGGTSISAVQPELVTVGGRATA